MAVKTEEEKTRSERVLEAIGQELLSVTQIKIAILFGAESLGLHNEATRIVFVPIGGPLEAPSQAGGALAPEGNKRIVACRIRAERCAAHIYAPSRAAVEKLFDALVGVMCEHLDADLRANEYRWVTEETEKAGKMLRSAKIEWAFTLRLPVSESVASLVGVQGFTTTEHLSEPPEE